MIIRPLTKVLLRRFLLAYILFVIGLSGIQFYFEYEKSRQSTLQVINELSDTFTPSVTGALWDYQEDLLNAVSRGIGNHPLVASVTILGSDGEKWSEWKVPAGYETDPELTVRRELPRPDRTIDGPPLGYLIIASSKEQSGAQLMVALFKVGFTIVVLLFFLLFTLWLLVSKLLGQPLTSFSRQVASLTQQKPYRHIDLDELNVKEIATLQQGFNHLMDEVSLYNDEMEQKVEQRTDELKRSEEENRSLIAALPDVIMRFDAKGRHLFVSDNVEEVTGIPAPSFIGKTHHELGFPENMCTFWEQAIQQPFHSKTTFETEFELDDPVGHVIFNWRLTPDFNAEGEVRSVLAVARNITQQKKAEQQVKLQAMVLDQIQDHVTVTDLKGTILYVNESKVREIGLNKEKIIGQNISVYGDDSDSDAQQKEIVQKTLEEGKWNGEIINLGVNEKKLIVDLRTSLVKGEQNIPVAMVGVATDITERKEVELFSQKTAKILEMIATGKPVADIYDSIALMYEERHPGMRCSMLELHNGKLMHGGAPSLPKTYCDDVNGLEYGPCVGSCGTSTYT